jgi:hypothetical protein
MPYYVTKYALTAGIIEVPDGSAKVIKKDKTGTEYLSCHWTPGDVGMFLLKSEFFTDLEAAKKDVKDRIESKLRSIEKQRVALQAALEADVKIEPFVILKGKAV